MGTKERSKTSSQRQNWQNIFNALVQMVQTQQSQLEALAKDRKLLEDRVRMQHERWVSDVHLLEDQIAQMKGDLLSQEMEGSLEAAKLELVLGLKQREAYLNKLKLEYADNELGDFKALFDLYTNKCSDLKGGGGDGSKRNSNTRSSKNAKEEKNRSKVLEDKIWRLKQDFDKLASEKSYEVSALLAEKKFVWNQYKIMENDYTNKLRSKNCEVEQADVKIQNLLASMEQLKSSNDEKDDKIATLKSKVDKVEAESSKLKDEISNLSRELDLLRKSRSASATPVLNHCTPRNRTSLSSNNSAKDRINVIVKKESSAARLPDPIKDTKKGSSSSKRNGDDVITICETPKLFSSRFKVPKLKNTSPCVR